MQRAEVLAGHHRLLRCCGPSAGVIEAEVDEGVQAGVPALDALDRGVDDLHR